jgi:hypothetical protein
MSMHLVRGMTSLNTRKKRAKSKSKRLAELTANHEKFLLSMGVKGTVKRQSRAYKHESVNFGERVTSDVIPGNGNKRTESVYTGTLIKGIAVTHKSNLMPITSSEQATDVAKMRRQ